MTTTTRTPASKQDAQNVPAALLRAEAEIAAESRRAMEADRKAMHPTLKKIIDNNSPKPAGHGYGKGAYRWDDFGNVAFAKRRAAQELVKLRRLRIRFGKIGATASVERLNMVAAYRQRIARAI